MKIRKLFGVIMINTGNAIAKYSLLCAINCNARFLSLYAGNYGFLTLTFLFTSILLNPQYFEAGPVPQNDMAPLW
jgi:hypothetical protein